MSPAEYVLSVLRQYPDNEMSCADLVGWEGNTQKFEKIAIYNTLAHLHGTGKVVKNSEGRATWWALAPESAASKPATSAAKR